jgi:NitT/TauT family transport system substrate-binding protein
MLDRRHFLCAAGALTLAPWTAVAEDLPAIRLATQVSGTVNWELTTIRNNGLDAANGFKLDVRDVDGSPAAQIAFQAGEADAIVSDWLWVARERAAGKDYVFIPYSRATGALMVPGDSKAQSIADLKGQSIGVAGGPVDKSWLILRAYARKVANMDLAAETSPVFGAPPLIFQKAIAGELGGAINFWHFGAKMQAKGMRPLVTVGDAARELGLDPQTPLLGYVVRESLLKPGRGGRARARLPLRQGAARARRRRLGGDPADHECEIGCRIRGSQGRLPRRHSGNRPGRRGRGLENAGADGGARRRGTGRQGNHPARRRLLQPRKLRRDDRRQSSARDRSGLARPEGRARPLRT